MGFIKKIYIIAIFCLLTNKGYSLDLKFKGDTTYTKKGEYEQLISRFGPEYRLNLHNPSHQKWLIYLGGRITFDYNHFGKELKSNVYTVLGIEF